MRIETTLQALAIRHQAGDFVAEPLWRTVQTPAGRSRGAGSAKHCCIQCLMILGRPAQGTMIAGMPTVDSSAIVPAPPR